jgi:hypothetical protein
MAWSFLVDGRQFALRLSAGVSVPHTGPIKSIKSASVWMISSIRTLPVLRSPFVRPLSIYKTQSFAYSSLVMANCFFEVVREPGNAEPQNLGRIVLYPPVTTPIDSSKLYDDIVPKTARNFRELCTREKGAV